VTGEHGHEAHRPRKRFGQHFLHERGVIERIIASLAPQPGERIVEIGPGEGALTLPLLARTGSLTAIELDRDLIPRLAEAARAVGELEIVQSDVLDVDLCALAAGHPLRLVGNLPYNISTPILFHVLGQLGCVTDMHFMLQREVVERMAAGPGSKVYGRLSVMLQARCQVDSLFIVLPGAFRPPPKVDSAVVRLTPLPGPAPSIAVQGALDRIVRAAFSQRRKTLHNAVRDVATDADLVAAGIDPRARAEDVAVDRYLALATHLSEAL